MADTNFLPEDYVEKKTQRRTNVISLTLFVVVMISIIGAFFVTDRQRVDVLEQQRQVNAQYAEAAKRLEQLDDLQERKQEMLRKAKVTAVLIERMPRSLILAELINNMPATLSLLELELKTKVTRSRAVVRTSMDRAKKKSKAKNKASEPTVKPSQVSLSLVGVAPTDVQVAQYMTALSRSYMFIDVNLVFSEETDLVEDHLMRKFKIDLNLKKGVSVEEIEPNLVHREINQDPMGNTIQIDASGQLVVPRDEIRLPVVVPVQDSPGTSSLRD